MMHLRFVRFTAIAITASLVATTAAEAQLYRVRGGGLSRRRAAAEEDNRASKTIVSVELLTGKGGVGLAAQQWRRVFEQIDFSVRIHRPVLDDKPGITERKYGRLREVKVVGKLDRSGKLVFPNNRTFAPGEGAKLAEWLKSLQVYGAQGSPEGRPVWGLSETQFGALYEKLSEEVTVELKGQPPRAAIAAMQLTPQYPVRFTEAAERALSNDARSLPAVEKTLKGHSKGTALALLLRDYGLGFRPLREPDGKIKLAIESLQDTAEVWPTGWKLKERRAKTVPALFKLVPVKLSEVKLVDALAGVSALTEVPIHIDNYGLKKRGIEIEKMTVSYPAKKTAWAVLLHGITVPYKLNEKYRIDERGRPFVWVTPLVPGDTD